MTAKHLSVSPFQRGQGFYNTGLSISANPYQRHEDRVEFRAGYNAALRRMHGFKKESPLP